MDSIPLITRVYSGKKLAEGLDALVMDVKVGSCAFMPTYDCQWRWPKRLLAFERCGRAHDGIADRDEPGTGIERRYAVEVREAVQFLTGEYRNPRLFDVTMALWWRC
ncbi:hypothetical protein ACNKHO_27835 [Shigella flexneri]